MKMQDELQLKYLGNLIELFLIMSILAFMMIYLIELNKIITIEILCGSLYQINQIKMYLRVKQQIYTMKGSKVRRGAFTKNITRIFFRERGKNS